MNLVSLVMIVAIELIVTVALNFVSLVMIVVIELIVAVEVDKFAVIIVNSEFDKVLSVVLTVNC